MGVSLLVLTILNIVLLAGLSLSLFLRVKEKREDQKLTKGLQLLQNKLSILQDLSDRTDEQVERLVHVLDNKSNELRKLISDSQISCADIADIIEILKEEKNISLKTQMTSIKPNDKHASLIYAAQMAHAGSEAAEIQKQTGLSPAEIEMIIKVNKDQLQFATENLPQWTTTVKNQNSLTQDEISAFAQSLNTSKSVPQSFITEKNIEKKETVKMSIENKIKPVEFRRI